MSTTALAGLAWMLLGFAALGLGRLTEGIAARTYVRSHPDGDVDRYIRGKTASCTCGPVPSSSPERLS